MILWCDTCDPLCTFPESFSARIVSFSEFFGAWVSATITQPHIPMNPWQIKALMFGSKWLFKPSGAALPSQHAVISQKWSESWPQVSHRHESGMKGSSEEAGPREPRPLWGGTRHFPRLLTSPTAEIPNTRPLLPHTDVCAACVCRCLWCCANEGELCNANERARTEKRWCFSSHQEQDDESGTAAALSLSPCLSVSF